MKPRRSIVFCRDSIRYKILFPSLGKADNFLKFNMKTILEETGHAPIRSYYCSYCGGWHVTSKESYERKSRTDIIIKLYQTEKFNARINVCLCRVRRLVEKEKYCEAKYQLKTMYELCCNSEGDYDRGKINNIKKRLSDYDEQINVLIEKTKKERVLFEKLENGLNTCEQGMNVLYPVSLTIKLRRYKSIIKTYDKVREDLKLAQDLDLDNPKVVKYAQRTENLNARIDEIRCFVIYAIDIKERNIHLMSAENHVSQCIEYIKDGNYNKADNLFKSAIKQLTKALDVDGADEKKRYILNQLQACQNMFDEVIPKTSIVPMKQDFIRLWTYQPLSIYNMVMEQGIAYCKEESPFSKELPWAYRWMAEQMRQRIDAPEIKDVQFPLWAWQYYRGKKRAKPRRAFDMVDSYLEEVVYMELLLPASRVLSSDFILWHQVLNRWGIDIEDGMKMKETWQRIFDKDFNHPDWTSKAWEDRIIQSTFWCLKKEDIVYADLLTRQEGRKALSRKRLYPIKN